MREDALMASEVLCGDDSIETDIGVAMADVEAEGHRGTVENNAKEKLEFPVEVLREIIDYDPDSGIMIWKRRKERECEWWSLRGARNFNAQFAGKEAGFSKKVKNRDYTRREIKLPDAKNYVAHRVIWAWYYGVWPKGQVDHIDQTPLNNRIKNLRDVDNGTNQRNATRRKDNQTGVTGVSKQRNKWIVRIYKDGKVIPPERFDTMEEAVARRKELEVELGFSKNHGSEKR